MDDRLVPTSAFDSLLWPAVPGDKGRHLLSILYQLDKTQWWTAEELAAQQFRQLGALVRHAHETVPFHRRRLGDAGIRADTALAPARWEDVPILRRGDVQEAGEALHSNRVPDDHGLLSVIFTSGSTGTPVRAVRTQLSLLFWSAFTLRDHLWHRRDLSGKLATIRTSTKGESVYPRGRVTRYWGTSRRAFDTGPSVDLNITSTVEEQCEWLHRQNPDYLLTHPTNVLRLAEHCRRQGIRIPRLKEVQTISEILRPEVREACREAWGVPVSDMYTSREIGYLALQCPDHEHYHVQAEGVYLEVVDDEGRRCRPGKIGRVIVTPLHNFAMPLLRYDVGDYAELGESCPCGRGLPVLVRILGREQNMLTLPSGEKRWTLLSSDDIRGFLDIAPIRQTSSCRRRRPPCWFAWSWRAGWTTRRKRDCGIGRRKNSAARSG